MASQPYTLHRKSSATWNRLKPAKQDPLESFGFVSKGDNRLLSAQNQEAFYHKITARYMQFCSRHSRNLNEAFTSLSLAERKKTSNEDNAVITSHGQTKDTGFTSSANLSTRSSLPGSMTSVTGQQLPDAADELSIILTALRKLREGILAASESNSSPVFSQRVHVFNIRLAILAYHPESYHASLRYLVSTLHSRHHPLPAGELREMLSFLILDTALRLRDFNEAYRLRSRARTKFNYQSADVDLILKAVATDNWPLFWKMRNRVDGYFRAIMQSRAQVLRRSVLKAIGKAYLKCDLDWILRYTTGNDMTWEELVAAEDIGWQKDGEFAIIRKPKPKT